MSEPDTKPKAPPHEAANDETNDKNAVAQTNPQDGTFPVPTPTNQPAVLVTRTLLVIIPGQSSKPSIGIEEGDGGGDDILNVPSTYGINPQLLQEIDALRKRKELNPSSDQEGDIMGAVITGRPIITGHSKGVFKDKTTVYKVTLTLTDNNGDGIPDFITRKISLTTTSIVPITTTTAQRHIRTSVQTDAHSDSSSKRSFTTSILLPEETTSTRHVLPFPTTFGITSDNEKTQTRTTLFTVIVSSTSSETPTSTTITIAEPSPVPRGSQTSLGIGLGVTMGLITLAGVIVYCYCGRVQLLPGTGALNAFYKKRRGKGKAHDMDDSNGRLEGGMGADGAGPRSTCPLITVTMHEPEPDPDPKPAQEIELTRYGTPEVNNYISAADPQTPLPQRPTNYRLQNSPRQASNVGPYFLFPRTPKYYPLNNLPLPIPAPHPPHTANIPAIGQTRDLGPEVGTTVGLRSTSSPLPQHDRSIGAARNSRLQSYSGRYHGSTVGKSPATAKQYGTGPNESTSSDSAGLRKPADLKAKSYGADNLTKGEVENNVHTSTAQLQTKETQAGREPVNLFPGPEREATLTVVPPSRYRNRAAKNITTNLQPTQSTSNSIHMNRSNSRSTSSPSPEALRQAASNSPSPLEALIRTHLPRGSFDYDENDDVLSNFGNSSIVGASTGNGSNRGITVKKWIESGPRTWEDPEADEAVDNFADGHEIESHCHENKSTTNGDGNGGNEKGRGIPAWIMAESVVAADSVSTIWDQPVGRRKYGFDRSKNEGSATGTDDDTDHC